MKNIHMLIKISLKFIPQVPINNTFESNPMVDLSQYAQKLFYQREARNGENSMEHGLKLIRSAVSRKMSPATCMPFGSVLHVFN